MKKIIIVTLLLVLSFTGLTSTSASTVSEFIKYFKVEKQQLEIENDIVYVGNFDEYSPETIDSLFNYYNDGYIISVYNLKESVVDIFSNEPIENAKMALFKKVGETDLSYVYLSNIADGMKLKRTKVYDLKEALSSFQTTKINEFDKTEVKADESTVFPEMMQISTYSTVDECSWTLEKNSQYTEDFAPYGRIISSVKAYICAQSEEEYWRVEVDNSWLPGRVLYNDPLIGDNYSSRYIFEDNANAYITMKLHKRTQYVGGPILYGSQVTHMMYYPLDEQPQTVTVTNSDGETIGTTTSGSFTPETYTVGFQEERVQSFTHTASYTEYVPSYISYQAGTIETEGYLSYTWMFNNFDTNDFDKRYDPLHRDMGVMTSIEPGASVGGFYLSLYVGMDLDKTWATDAYDEHLTGTTINILILE